MRYLFIIIIAIFFIISANLLIDQTEAMFWPRIYNTVSIDSRTDKAVSASDEHEIYQGDSTDTFHNIFTRLQISNVALSLLTDTAFQTFLNPPQYSLIWYRFKLKYKGSSQYDLTFSRSINNQFSWSNVETHTNIRLTNGEYNSGTLGVKVTSGSPGYVEFYTKKQYIEEPAFSFNFYFSTLYGAFETQGDRAPDSGTNSNNLSEPINQLTINSRNLAPKTADQGEINVPMTILTMSTNAGTVEWIALRIDKRGTSVQDFDVDRIKLWKDDGDQTLKTDKDMLVANALDAFINSVASVTLKPSQILTTVNAHYFITYDIDWFANPDVTVGMYIRDKTYFTVSSPDNVNLKNFPFEAGNSKITPASYLSFNITGLDASVRVEGETTDLSVGGSGWIDFGSLPPNKPIVVAQKLNVTTNTKTGYRITIKEDQNLTDFRTQETIADVPGTNTSPQVWPAVGGFGYHTSDDSLGTGVVNRFFGDDTYAAITSSSEEVAYHGSAVNGQVTSIVYKLEIGASQMIGEYSNVITYICTTTY